MVRRTSTRNDGKYEVRGKGGGVNHRQACVEKILISVSVSGAGNIDRTIWVRACMHLAARVRGRVQRPCRLNNDVHVCSPREKSHVQGASPPQETYNSQRDKSE